MFYGTYATLKTLKSRLALTSTDYDTDLLQSLENCSRDIDDLCNRYFYCREGTLYFDGAGSMLLFGVAPDLLSIGTSGFKLDTTGAATFETTLATMDYVLYPLNQFPKTHCKLSSNPAIGSFASGIRQGVKITGVFGFGDGTSATPYSTSGVAVNTGGITDSVTSHALASGNGSYFSAGMTIRIDSEQLYVTRVIADTLTFVRAVNGTSAAAHLAAAAISIYSYPGPIIEAALIQAVRNWKRRESAYETVKVDTVSGTTYVYKGLDPDVKLKIDRYILRRY